MKKDKEPLSITHPEIAKEAYGWDPNDFTAGSSAKKHLWKCTNNHTWLAKISARSKANGTNCPVCSNQKLLPGYNDLATTHPDLALEADGWDPKTIISSGWNEL